MTAHGPGTPDPRTGAPRDAVVGDVRDRRDPAWDLAWSDALEALEIELAEAERMLALDHLAVVAPSSAWVPPSDLPPLPAALADRARALLDRQLAVAESLARAAAQSRRHQRAVDAMRTAPPAPPVYVDTPA